MQLNRGQGGAEAAKNVNEAGAAFGFKVTGDAAFDEESTDYAMFSDEGNRLVADLVRRTRDYVEGAQECEAFGFLGQGRKAIADAGHDEVYDTMVRETMCYALDGVWEEFFGHAIDQWEIPF
jgi:hypothetical protein